MIFKKYETNYKFGKCLKLSEIDGFKEGIAGKENNIVIVYPEIEYQEIIGFGGALTESSGFVFSKFPEDIKDKFIKEYFSEQGIGYNFCRLPIQSCDFSLSSYCYLDIDSLDNFSIKRDTEYIIPLIKAAQKEGEQLGLTADELAFYDALTKPQAIKDFYENEELIAITKELADTLRKNRTIDWQKRDSARAKMRMMIKKLLKKHRYPPEGMDDAVQTVMTQCELWTDNVGMEHDEQKIINYSFRQEQNIGMVADKPAQYGNRD